MKESSTSAPVYFSHRPKAGVSIGVSLVGEEIYIGIAFTNNGINFIGRYNKLRTDRFSRVRAREIIKGRIEATQSGKEVDYVAVFAASGLFDSDKNRFDLGKFMSELRKWFKPDHKEVPVANDWWEELQSRNIREIAERIFNRAADILGK